jgi:hypothetical protein
MCDVPSASVCVVPGRACPDPSAPRARAPCLVRQLQPQQLAALPPHRASAPSDRAPLAHHPAPACRCLCARTLAPAAAPSASATSIITPAPSAATTSNAAATTAAALGSGTAATPPPLPCPCARRFNGPPVAGRRSPDTGFRPDQTAATSGTVGSTASGAVSGTAACRPPSVCS